MNLINFDDNGRLFIDHECNLCSRFPLENLEEPCLECGVSQRELIELEGKIERANKAIDTCSKFDNDDRIDVREASLKMSGITLGGDAFDQIIFTDIEQTDEIRGLSDLVDHMCTIVIYPTQIRDMFDKDEDDELEELL